jgi:hypothetical protein
MSRLAATSTIVVNSGLPSSMGGVALFVSRHPSPSSAAFDAVSWKPAIGGHPGHLNRTHELRKYQELQREIDRKYLRRSH